VQEAFDDDVTFMDIDDKWIDKLRAPRGKEMLALQNIAAVKVFLDLQKRELNFLCDEI
jgi:hypothetical protein